MKMKKLTALLMATLMVLSPFAPQAARDNAIARDKSRANNFFMGISSLKIIKTMNGQLPGALTAARTC